MNDEHREWTPEEQKANRKKLVEALRSWEYKQGSGVLYQGGKTFSVLGVACDLAIKEGVVPDWEYSIDHNCYICDNASFLLPNKVKRWLGFKGRYGRYTMNENIMFTLGEDNDYGVPFVELAEIIESEPKDLIGKDIHDKRSFN